jgi:hypothetical protein
VTERPERQPPPPRGASIGVAHLDEEGAIVLDLRATDGRGIVGDARLVYPKTDARYREILEHLGGLVPGETKRVRPWPERR